MNLPTRGPHATYRVQLHEDFNFDHLAQIIPYLDELGISDVYLSPIFRAMTGSSHGYDVCDQNEVSPELGGREGLEKIHALLHERGMGMVLDFVPNHMGIQDRANWRWVDVLENGRLSRFANFFDIQWNPRQAALRDRIIVPVLHDFYGRVLEAGQIRIDYHDDSFWINYGSLRLPVWPESYEIVLHDLAWLKDPGKPLSKKLEDLAGRFRSLPKPASPENLDEIEKRNQQRDALRQEFAVLLHDENLAEDLSTVLTALNGDSSKPESFDRLHQLLEEQNYRLAYWKTGTHEINYRRFFAIDTLVGVRMGAPEVFDETHRLLKELIGRGMVAGVRIDHIDGLWDPAQYLERLAALGDPEGKPIYSLVEKILTEKEDMPAGWMTHGTTGYDFAATMINLLIASKSEAEFTRIYREFAGITIKPDEQAYRLKLYIMDDLFPNALDNFALELEARVKTDRRWRDWTVSDLRPALSQIIACLSVYRTYRVTGEPPSPEDVSVVEHAVAEALRMNHAADPMPFHFIEGLWTGRYPDEKAGPEMKAWADEWICKLQQYTGAIMAKSVEDTFFYRYLRLFAANEVGHHPAEFGRPVSDFHTENQKRLKDWPASMLGTSTHDTKTSEDVRTRLLALSEIPEQWDAALHRWSKMNHVAKTLANNVLAPDANEEYLLYQILLGAWPLEESEIDDDFCQRIKAYMRKALSESKARTNWANPDEAWVKACDKFIDTILDPKAARLFWQDFLPFAREIAYQGMKMSLVQVALKITSPGVPDFYQGTELWDLSLVDPDNRRPVDFGARLEALQELDEAPVSKLVASWKDGRIKMRVIRSLLHFRREHPDLFLHGDYEPLKIAGPLAERFVAFSRRLGGEQLVVVALRRMVEDGVIELGQICEGMSVPLPRSGAGWREIISGREIEPDTTELVLADVFDELPFVVLAGTAI
jgi:(1->4)-alpha-D-glucan 1-alpha-D-glucosylmutase